MRTEPGAAAATAAKSKAMWPPSSRSLASASYSASASAVGGRPFTATRRQPSVTEYDSVRVPSAYSELVETLV